MNVLDLVENMRSVGNGGKGPEYHGACPSCGGRANSDRFVVWPDQNDGQGSWWCRGCDSGGDLIQFRMEYLGENFPTAAAAAGRDLSEMPMVKNQSRPAAKEYEPMPYDSPRAAWLERAERLVFWAEKELLKNNDQLKWLSGRGINLETIQKYRIGWNPGENGKDIFRPRGVWGLPEKLKSNGRKKMMWIPRGLVIPGINQGEIIRIRIRRPVEHRTDKSNIGYYVVPGSGIRPFISSLNRAAVIVVESELDGLMLSNEVGDLVSVLALGSAQVKQFDQTIYDYLKKSLCILIGLDFDQAGAKSKIWWRQEFGQKVRRLAPLKGKDPGEDYAAGVDMKTWVLSMLPPAWRLGLSHLSGGKGGGADPAPVVAEIEVDQDEKTPVESRPAPVEVKQLFLLIKNAPVEIYATGARITLNENEAWAKQCRERSRKISQLVFNPVCMKFLAAHPETLINAANFWGDNGSDQD